MESERVPPESDSVDPGQENEPSNDINNNTIEDNPEEDSNITEDHIETEANNDDAQVNETKSGEKSNHGSEAETMKEENKMKENDVDAHTESEIEQPPDNVTEKEETKTIGDASMEEAKPEQENESIVTTPTPATKIRLASTRKHTTTPADDSGFVQPSLPNIKSHKNQANIQQMTTSITHARKQQEGMLPAARHPIRNRVPPKLVRLATVTVSPARARPNKATSLYYEEPRRPSKVITWDQATNHRPPLRIDMEGPGPCSYSPLNKPLGETNAPCFTFGTKCFPEKEGGARTSWGKSWFQSSHLYQHKADYAREGLWPSPNHYPKPALLGPRQRTMTEYPSFTFGHKQNFSIIKPGAAKEPSPNDYDKQNADKLILRRGPSFTHQVRREGTMLWGSTERTPAPCSYSMDRTPRVHRPAYTIQGIRREKSHILGPYSTL